MPTRYNSEIALALHEKKFLHILKMPEWALSFEKCLARQACPELKNGRLHTIICLPRA
jgi:hypothetical protein